MIERFRTGNISLNMSPWFAFSIISVVILSLSTGCRSPEEKDVLRLRFWNGFTGPDGRTMLKIVRRFNEENPDVHVSMQRMDWGTYYNKVFVAGIGGRAPDVFVVHTDSLPRFQSAGLIHPVDGLIHETPDWGTEDLDEKVWQSVEFEGSHYAIPLDVHMLGLYYNVDLFRKAGLVNESGDATPPKNREEFLQQLELFSRMAKTDGSSVEWGFVLTWYRTNCYTLMAQNGGVFFNEDKSLCIINNPENVRALEFFVDLIQEKKLVPQPANFDSWIGFRQGKVAMAFEGVYMLGDLKKTTDLNYAAAPTPTLGDHPAAWAASHNLCINPSISHEQRQAAWRFVRYLSDNSLEWAEAGQVPVRKSLRQSERFKEMKVQHVFARQLDRIVYGPQVEFSVEFWAEFDIAVEAALRGTVSPEQALAHAEDRINEVIMRQKNLKKGRR